MSDQPQQSPAVQEFAACIRESLLEMASKGHKAHALGIEETQMLVLMAPVIEPLVQSIVRRAGGR